MIIRTVIFDFGGVLSDEGFKQGLTAIGERNNMNPEALFATAEELIYETGYVTGAIREHDYWNALRTKTGIGGSDKELREEILKRFTLREDMLNHVKMIKSAGLITAILSDQTNWLEEINQNIPFFHLFDHVFNSYSIHKGKRDPLVFTDVCSAIGIAPEETLFVDDNIENIKRARDKGLHTLHFHDTKCFAEELQKFISSDT
jgi:putative hydrolase of the HAD superfamily